MPIDIHLKNINSVACTTPEYNAACDIQAHFLSIAKKDKNVSGDIYIIANQSLSGQKRNDIDLMVFGFTDGLTVECQQRLRIFNGEEEEADYIILKSFMATIELKSHDSSRIRMEANNYYVEYNSRWHDATLQSKEAKFSLVNFIDQQKWLHKSLFICDVLWFESITKVDLNELREMRKDNAMAGAFDLSQFTAALLTQTKAIKKNDKLIIDFLSIDGIDKVIKFFTTKRILKGLTLRKFNIISNSLLKDMTHPTENALTVAEGMAGSGKTLWLLQNAIEYSSRGTSTTRCLLLTYNKALVYDIRRIIDGFLDNTPCPVLQSVHSYLRELMKEAGIDTSILNSCGEKYEEIFTQKTEELKALANSSLQKYDYVFIDESQDLTSDEKDVFLKVFGHNHIIAAEGIDQFMRDINAPKWSEKCDKFEILPFEKTKRQKSNLVAFVNALALETGLNWFLKSDSQLVGGRIKIFRVYNSSIHIDLLRGLRDNECEEYDLMVLVPPSLIVHDYATNRCHFAKREAFKKSRIRFFDATDPHSREMLPRIDACRILPYQSCRGLEGWSVVCYMMDEMYDTIYSQAKVSASYSGLNTDVDRRHKAMRWLMMPLTRPIDTLVITLKNPDSEFGKMLKKISETYPDFIDWNC